MGRLWQLIVGFFRLFVSSVENKHPEIAYDNAIEDQKIQFSKLRKVASAVIRRANDLEAKYKEHTALKTKLEGQLEVAARMANPDIEAATFLQSQFDELEQALIDEKSDWDGAEKDEADIREALLEVQRNLKQLIGERDREIGRFHSANARISVQDQLEGIGITASLQALENVRGTIKNRVAEANLAQDLASNSLDARLKKFSKATEAESARDKFFKRREAVQGKTAVPKAF